MLWESPFNSLASLYCMVGRGIVTSQLFGSAAAESLPGDRIIKRTGHLK